MFSVRLPLTVSVPPELLAMVAPFTVRLPLTLVAGEDVRPPVSVPPVSVKPPVPASAEVSKTAPGVMEMLPAPIDPPEASRKSAAADRRAAAVGVRAAEGHQAGGVLGQHGRTPPRVAFISPLCTLYDVPVNAPTR